jgi:dimethylamine/trimethylamine dehydrogenase
VLLATARLPDDGLYSELRGREAAWADAGVASVDVIGDAQAPGMIVHAVYAGHRYAQELGVPRDGEVAFRRHFHVGP